MTPKRKVIVLLASLCLTLCACQADNPNSAATEHAAQLEELNTLSVEKALELVRTFIGHEDSYIPLEKIYGNSSAVIGDVYSVTLLGDQVAVTLLYNYIHPKDHPKEELDSKWFFFHLESYLIDNLETGAWHTSSLNDFAVDKNTGEVVARLALDGCPNKVPGSPYWSEEVQSRCDDIKAQNR